MGATLSVALFLCGRSHSLSPPISIQMAVVAPVLKKLVTKTGPHIVHPPLISGSFTTEFLKGDVSRLCLHIANSFLNLLRSAPYVSTKTDLKISCLWGLGGQERSLMALFYINNLLLGPSIGKMSGDKWTMHLYWCGVLEQGCGKSQLCSLSCDRKHIH